jgi:hypothetical protein
MASNFIQVYLDTSTGNIYEIIPISRGEFLGTLQRETGNSNSSNNNENGNGSGRAAGKPPRNTTMRKQKKANEWIKFTQRVRGLIERTTGKKLGVEATQFAGELKEKLSKTQTNKPLYESISDEDILREYQAWNRPEHSKKELTGYVKRQWNAEAKARAAEKRAAKKESSSSHNEEASGND